MKSDKPAKLPERSEASDASLRIQIRKVFHDGERSKPVAVFLLDVKFAIPEGITMLFGPSGSGKTTLLDCIAGIRIADSGRIDLNEIPLFDSTTRTDIPSARRGIGYVFQNLALFPHLTLEQNVGYGLFNLSPVERRKRVDEILDRFRIAHLRDRKPREVSGGERQRVALVRALVTDPRALLLDEPLSALDRATKAGIIDDLRAWNDEHRLPILYVTHSREEVFALGERVIALEQGRVTAEGTPLEVLSAPRTEAIAGWMGLENIFDARVVALHEKQGTMLCQIQDVAGGSAELEVPLGRALAGDKIRVGVGAGEILVASSVPQGLSARNILRGELKSMERREVMLVARVDCGVPFVVHLTPGAQDALSLVPGKTVWLVIKTYSCHLLQRSRQDLL